VFKSVLEGLEALRVGLLGGWGGGGLIFPWRGVGGDVVEWTWRLRRLFWVGSWRRGGLLCDWSGIGVTSGSFLSSQLIIIPAAPFALCFPMGGRRVFGGVVGFISVPIWTLRLLLSLVLGTGYGLWFWKVYSLLWYSAMTLCLQKFVARLGWAVLCFFLHEGSTVASRSLAARRLGLRAGGSLSAVSVFASMSSGCARK